MVIRLENMDSKTRLRLQLEDGEIDDYLKIYTNYVRVDDGYGDWHYDLYFNVQNLLNSPFEYISSVTNQPNVLIIPDSYLYLTGDKFKRVYDDGGTWTHNEIDDGKLNSIKNGGVLSIYGQIKTYSHDVLSSVRTLKLFEYKVYNVSDDKPKFLIEKTYDITKSTMNGDQGNEIRIEFGDVMFTVDEISFKSSPDGDDSDKFRELDKDVIVVQPVKIVHDWKKDTNYRINRISFDIVNDVIDFQNTPHLCEYWIQSRPLRNGEESTMEGIDHPVAGKPYYDHWSDRYMNLEFDNPTGVPRMTLTYGDSGGFNFETVYLRWRVPSGCKVMDTVDRLGGYLFSSTARNVNVEISDGQMVSEVKVTPGYVRTRVHEPGKMYLGLEHSTTMRKNGYVLVGLASAIASAIGQGEKNPTFTGNNVVSEDELKDKVVHTANK